MSPVVEIRPIFAKCVNLAIGLSEHSTHFTVHHLISANLTQFLTLDFINDELCNTHQFRTINGEKFIRTIIIIADI